MTARPCIAAAAAAALAGCAAPPPPPPPLLPSPRVVVVVPTRDTAGARDAALHLDVFAWRQLAERGYYAVPVDVGLELLRACGAGVDEPDVVPGVLAALGERFGVDAVLGAELREFERLDDASIRFAVRWTMTSVGGAFRWEHDDRGVALGNVERPLGGRIIGVEDLEANTHGPWLDPGRRPLAAADLAAGLALRMGAALPRTR